LRAVRRYPAKPIDHDDHISVLIPTRGRPEGIRRVLENFQRAVEQKALFDVWIYVDDDDRLTLDYIESGHWRTLDYRVHWHVAPGKASMGEMFSELWQECSTNPGIYFPFCDDYVVETRGWDEVLRRCYQGNHNGFMLGYLNDPTACPHQVTIAIPSARWLNSVGYFVSDRFYYWFGDAWMDEVAQMVECKVLIPIKVFPLQGKGKTPRMRNLPFWACYYRDTLEERFREGCQILEEMHGAGTPEFLAARERARRTAAALLHKNYSKQIEEHRQTEKQLRDFSKQPSPTQIVSYLVLEARAVEELLGKVQRATEKGAAEEVLDLLDSLELASFSIPNLQYLKAEALLRLGFKDQALDCVTREMALCPAEPMGAMLRREIEASDGTREGNYHDGRSMLRLPSWLGVEDRAFLLFPDQIDLELYFTLQAILYENPGVESVLDVGAGNGDGSCQAVMEAAERLPNLQVYCIEPDQEKFARLTTRYGTRAHLYNAMSVPPECRIEQAELERFYHGVPSILNALPLPLFQQALSQEINYEKVHRIPTAAIAAIKRNHGITRFGMVILDGSIFCGRADLDEVYGARYLALSYVRSIKNMENFRRLTTDPAYRLIAANLDSGCGYAVFARIERQPQA